MIAHTVKILLLSSRYVIAADDQHKIVTSPARTVLLGARTPCRHVLLCYAACLTCLSLSRCRRIHTSSAVLSATVSLTAATHSAQDHSQPRRRQRAWRPPKNLLR
eukprot:6212720-Pleurochrysis_carterae.AAC.3